MPRDLPGLEVKREGSFPWSQQLLLFALLFAMLVLMHAPLLRLPYFWDEAGYYVPAARDLYLHGTLIPHSTPSNAHPPLVMALLAGAWRIAAFSPLVTRIVMLAVAAFSLLGLFRLAKSAANTAVACGTTSLVAVYPVFFAQSSLAHVDLAAAGLTFWALTAYVEGRRGRTVLWFSLAALTKETAILAPLGLLAWEWLAALVPQWRAFAPPLDRRTSGLVLLVPLVPLTGWYAYHYAQMGFLFGNPEFVRYNVTATLAAWRVLLALGLRCWQVFGYFGMWLLTLVALLALRRAPVVEQEDARQRIPVWIQAVLLAVLIAYLLFMSIVGGAVLARYMLPTVPLVILVLVSTVRRRMRQWRILAIAIAILFVAGLFTNPPYGFAPEDNLAYRDYVVMHAEASRFLALRYPHARVLTAWPASDELSRPWLGYVNNSFPVLRIEDFTSTQVGRAVSDGRFDVALAFSTKYEPPHPLLGDWGPWQRLKEEYFGYHRDLSADEIAVQLGGRIVFQEKREGQWLAVIAVERAEDAALRSPRPSSTVPSQAHAIIR